MTNELYYPSPIGVLHLLSDEEGLTAAEFDDAEKIGESGRESLSPFLADTVLWLDTYFSGEVPGFTPKLHLTGTDFQMSVWQKLLEIPYGETASYGAIARSLAKERRIPKMSAQAVGGAVGKNKIVIIVPCHRVIGSDGSLTGFSAGIERKTALLDIEGISYRK